MADVTEKLERLASLLEKGIITREELEQQKQQLLSGTAPDLSGSTRVATPADAAPLSGSTRVATPADADPLSGSTRMATPAGPDLSGATRVAAPSALPAQLGSYRVIEIIGEGGMGQVVRARHIEESWARREGGDVAIKLVHRHLAADSEFRERFLDEAGLGRRLQHPGLARVQGVISEGTWLGAIMEYIEGEPLTDRVVAEGLPVESVVELLSPIAEALDHLHSEGIIHRDLKPDNIKIRPDGRPVILDLGIAKDTASDGGHTRTSTAMGTTAWMAPEQADAKSVTPAADRYALGMIAYVLLSGRLPWDAGTSEARIGVVKLMDQLQPLQEARPGIEGRVATCVMGMLALEPSDRPESCGAFVETVRQALKEAEEERRRKAEAEARRKAEAERRRKAEEERRRKAEAERRRKAEEQAEIDALLSGEEQTEIDTLLAEAERAAAAKAAKKRNLMLAVLGLVGLGAVGGFVMLGEDDKAADKEKEKALSDFEMVKIPAGTFEMGSPKVEDDRDSDETQHTVTLSEGFHISATEVTQALYEAVTGVNPSSHSGCATCPVESVSWFDAVAFCNALSELEDLKPAYDISGETVTLNEGASGYRLPTEAEWEYAARAGETHTYAGSNSVDDVAWYSSNSGNKTHPVGTLEANAWGLHDMSGNVWEWTGDWYASDYPTGSVTDPEGPPTGGYRVYRGGCFVNAADGTRAADRGWNNPGNAGGYQGFRVVLPE